MRHLIATIVLVVAFFNLSHGGPDAPPGPTDSAEAADASDAADDANTDSSEENVTTLSATILESFLEKMETSRRYWTLMTSYQDPTQTQKRMCISTEETEVSGADGDTVFVQKYKLEGCLLSSNTHDAYYNVTFIESSNPTDDLEMQWVPIPHAKQRTKTDVKVNGRQRDYTFKYWNDKEECFVLTFNSTADKKECELLVWNPEVAAKPRTQLTAEARTEDKTETTLEGTFMECLKQYKTECPKASDEILFDSYCKSNEAKFRKLITENPEKIDASLCSEQSQ